MNQAIDSLNALSDVPDDEATRKTLSTLSLRQLESRVSQTLDDLQNAQNDLATYNSQLVSLQTQPERVQNAMYSASQQLQQIRNRLNGTSTGEETLRPTQQSLLLAQQALLNAQIDQQRKSLKVTRSCRIPCKSSVITSPPTATVLNTSFSYCRKR